MIADGVRRIRDRNERRKRDRSGGGEVVSWIGQAVAEVHQPGEILGERRRGNRQGRQDDQHTRTKGRLRACVVCNAIIGDLPLFEFLRRAPAALGN
jgi:hypothetical protein